MLKTVNYSMHCMYNITEQCCTRIRILSKLYCQKLHCIQSGWHVLQTLIGVKSFKVKKAVMSRNRVMMMDQCRHRPPRVLALVSRPHQPESFWHFSSDRVQTQTRLWLRLIRSTLEIMRDYTLVCVSTNRTIVFSQAAVLTGGFTEAKGSGISLSEEPKCWVEQSCPPLQKPPEYRSKQHCLQSEREW